MIIDFSSRPPEERFDTGNVAALENYRRVYRNSEVRIGPNSKGESALRSYLAAYERLEARAVVIKARDSSSTMGIMVRNEDVAAFCDAHGPRYIGFAGVDPHSGASAVSQFEDAVRGLNLQGLNIQCFEHGLAPNDKLLYPLYEKCCELDVPVNVHTGINFSSVAAIDLGRPIHLDQVLRDFPDLRVCASPPGWPWVHELIAIAMRHRNLMIGLVAIRPKLLARQGSGYEPLLTYGTTILSDRILFGSAWPMQSLEDAVDEITELPVPKDVRSKWLHDNAAAFLRLDPA